MSGPLYRIDQEDDRLVMWEFRSGSTIVIVIMSVMVDADKNKRKKYEKLLACWSVVGVRAGSRLRDLAGNMDSIQNK